MRCGPGRLDPGGCGWSEVVRVAVNQALLARQGWKSNCRVRCRANGRNGTISTRHSAVLAQADHGRHCVFHESATSWVNFSNTFLHGLCKNFEQIQGKTLVNFSNFFALKSRFWSNFLNFQISLPWRSCPYSPEASAPARPTNRRPPDRDPDTLSPPSPISVRRSANAPITPT
jgi:hypothetical protein